MTYIQSNSASDNTITIHNSESQENSLDVSLEVFNNPPLYEELMDPNPPTYDKAIELQTRAEAFELVTYTNQQSSNDESQYFYESANVEISPESETYERASCEFSVTRFCFAWFVIGYNMLVVSMILFTYRFWPEMVLPFVCISLIMELVVICHFHLIII